MKSGEVIRFVLVERASVGGGKGRFGFGLEFVGKRGEVRVEVVYVCYNIEIKKRERERKKGEYIVVIF